MRIAILSLIGLSLIGCKSAKPVVNETTSTNDSSNIVVVEVDPSAKEPNKEDVNRAEYLQFLRSYNRVLDYVNTVVIKASAKYSDEKQDQSVSADIRIKKDEVIWLSIKFLGIPMAKAMITPDKVQYFEKLNGTYFEGDYQTLSNWLGTELDFKRVQNILMGRPIAEVDISKVQIDGLLQKFSIKDASEDNVEKVYDFEGNELRKTQILQSAESRNLEIDYPNFAKNFPTQLFIQALHEKGKTNIRMNYNQVLFNEQVSFPYSVPNGYERVFIE